MICPLCHTEMDFDLNTNRWSCSRSVVVIGGPPTYVLDAITLEQIPTESLVRINPFTLEQEPPPLTPPPPPWGDGWMPQVQFVPAPGQYDWDGIVSTLTEQTGQIGVPAAAPVVDERTEREKAREWFNPMPKALKLLYIALDPEIADVLHHYKEWDARKMEFREFCGSTQRVIVKAYAEKHPS